MENPKKSFSDVWIQSKEEVNLKFINESIRNYLSSGFVVCLGTILFSKNINYPGKEIFGILTITLGLIVMTMNGAKVLSGIMVYFKGIKKESDSTLRKFFILSMSVSLSVLSFYVLNGLIATQIAINVK